MRIGIIGGGQLARMMAIAGFPLGLRFVVLDPAADACAADLCDHIQADFDDLKRLEQLAERCDCITFDFENVPVSSIRHLARKTRVFPAAGALAVAQNRIDEKQLFASLGIPVAPWRPIGSFAELQQAAAEIGLPAVLKTSTLGYDGKGQVRLHTPEELAAGYKAVGEVSCVLEAMVAFKRELSIIAVRGQDGDVRFYPLTENRHKQGILVSSFAPAAAADLMPMAQDYARRVLEHFDYVGVLTIEFFDQDGRLVANEMAPRVHNSGHWTIEGAACSQFENHLRAVAGWPLGSTESIGHTAMLNWIGALPPAASALKIRDAHWHDYGKAARPKRKVGHMTVRADDLPRLQATLTRFAQSLGNDYAAGTVSQS